MKLRRDKLAWLQHECSLITEPNAERKSKKLFNQIKKLKPSSTHIKNQILNDKKGKTLTETADVLKRWTEYGSELF